MDENEKQIEEQDFNPESEAPEAPSEGESVPEVPRGDDLIALAKQYNMEPAAVIKAYGESRTKMAKANQEYADYRKRMTWAEQFQHELTTRKGLREHIEHFFEDSNDRGVPPEVRSAIDPVAQELASVRASLVSMEMNNKLDAIAKSHPMDSSIRDAVFEEVYKSNNPDVEAHYWKLMGPKIAASKDEAIRDGAVAGRNREAYTPLKGGAAKAKGAVGNLPHNEWSEALDNDLASMFRRTE